MNRLLQAALLTVAGTVLVGCGGGGTNYAPDVAGVVASIGTDPDGATRYVLEDGREVTIDLTHNPLVVYGSGGPQVGELLLSGTAGSRRWVARLTLANWQGAPDGCYALHGYGSDREGSVQTDVGLRLPKAPDFTATSQRGDRFEGSFPVFCINRDGQATAFL